MNSTLEVVVPWFVAWHLLFWIAKAISPSLFSTYKTLDAPTQSYWAASIVSTAHAIYIVVLALRAGATIDVLNTTDIHATSPESTNANSIFIAYLASDLLLSLYYNSKWAGWQANLIHHTFGIAAWTCMNDGGFAHSVAICAMLTEATTPFINQRFFFDKAGMKSGSLYLVNGLLMTVLWFILRVLMFGWLGWRLFLMREGIMALPFVHRAVALSSYVVGYALQLFWFDKILRGALKALKGPKKSN